MFQEVFARVYERLDTLRDDGGAAVDRAADAERVHRPHPRGRAARSSASTLDEGADDELERLEEAFAVREALAALSPDCREILDRFFCRDESYRTIGEELELPVRHDRQPYLALPQPSQNRAGGKIDRRSDVK